MVAHCLSVELESPDGHGDTMMDPEQRIWGFETNFGGLAELALVKSNQLMPKPAHLTWEEAAAPGLVNSTAYRQLVSRNGAGMKQGDTVLIWGASGGLGSYATQFALNGGATPVCVVSSPQKAEICRAMGAELIIDRSAEGYKFWRDEHNQDPKEWKRFGAKIRELTGGDDPDIVFEHPGRETFGASVYVTRKGGTIVTCASTSGFEHQYDNRYLWMNLKRIVGSHFANYRESYEANRLIDKGLIHPTLSKVYPLEETGQAALDVHTNSHQGKVGVLALAPRGGTRRHEPGEAGAARRGHQPVPRGLTSDLAQQDRARCARYGERMAGDAAAPLPPAGFEVVRRGYDQEQVEAHLRRLDAEMRILATDRDAAVDQSAQLTRELDDSRARAERLRAQVRTLVSPQQSVQGMSERMRSMLRMAEDEVAEMLQRADNEVAKNLHDAEQKAAGIVEEARAEADADPHAVQGRGRGRRGSGHAAARRAGGGGERAPRAARGRPGDGRAGDRRGARPPGRRAEGARRGRTLADADADRRRSDAWTESENRRRQVEADFRIAMDQRRKEALTALTAEQLATRTATEEMRERAHADGRRMIEAAQAEAARIVADAEAAVVGCASSGSAWSRSSRLRGPTSTRSWPRSGRSRTSRIPSRPPRPPARPSSSPRPRSRPRPTRADRGADRRAGSAVARQRLRQLHGQRARAAVATGAGGLAAPPAARPAAGAGGPARRVPVPPVGDRAVVGGGPRHQVRRARRDDLVAAGATVVAGRRRPADLPHLPLAVRRDLDAPGRGRAQRHVVLAAPVGAGHGSSAPVVVAEPVAGLAARAARP